jgi:hypothetical protein
MKVRLLALGLTVILAGGAYVLVRDRGDQCVAEGMWIDGVPGPRSQTWGAALTAFLLDSATGTPAEGYRRGDFVEGTGHEFEVAYRTADGLIISLRRSFDPGHMGWHVTKVERVCT